MHGTPLGGGLEITLACHFRVAAPDTRLGLPESSSASSRGAERSATAVVGVEKALEMILSQSDSGEGRAQRRLYRRNHEGD